MGEKKDFTNPSYYTNRELSWLMFNRRVLSEAKDVKLPLFERLKFLSITASNLDEFFMVRVASLKDMVNAKYNKPDIAGMKPKEQLEALNKATHALVKEQYQVYNKQLLPGLSEAGVRVVERHEDLTDKQAAYVDRYFSDNVYPVLTPMAVDSSRPFPLVRNKTLNLGALVKKKQGKGEVEFATVQVPGVLSRVVEIPGDGEGRRCLIFLEQIIERNIDRLFLNYDIECVWPFRIMRNADLSIEEDEAEDLLKEIEKQLKKRQWGQVIRLEIESGMDEKLLNILEEELMVQEEDVYAIKGPLDLTVLMKLYGLEGYEELKTPKYTPQLIPEFLEEGDIFTQIRQHDIFLHHPYQTFEPVVDFVKQASRDSEVLAIKQTLYRVSGNSPIIAALEQAAENGKQVTVLVELKARFDEENNILWAKRLEKAGCHVIYGLVGLKTHCKITLVVRREEDGIRRYVHLGTGNYNDSTAKLYTDVGLMTCNEQIGEDATAVFNMLSGYSEPRSWNKLSVAPLWLKDRFLSLIGRERDYALKGHHSHIIAKMNALCDKDVIVALYEASAAGVKIELIVRGICCLKTGIPGVSENITVRSIVGNFLEHARIFYFENDGKPEIYCASADWMPRNLERRVEIMFPIEKEGLKQKAMHILECQLKDNMKAHMLTAEGNYEKVNRRVQDPFCAQEIFCREAKGLVKKEQHSAERVFIPEMHIE
ncbi:RNA degradosome polyphosphate kinase [bacterium 1XD8-76]|nr:RNA degradosome polyphosphate kinase [bacterium 1XD8-76]